MLELHLYNRHIMIWEIKRFQRIDMELGQGVEYTCGKKV